MDTPQTLLLLLLAIAVVTVPLSLLVESLRPRPEAPGAFAWAPDIPVQYLTVDGIRLRYLRTGRGPNLVLLHTLRTQLDIFQKMIPDLSGHFTVHALDYPGHGFSDIPHADYRPDLFVRAVEGFLDALDIRDATLAGISIGGVIPLLIAARGNPRVRRVVSINPYDYAGDGVRRGNFTAWLILGLARVPVLGDTVMRLRNAFVERRIFEGGVADPTALQPELVGEMYAVGARNGHYRAFLNLLRNARAWEQVHETYGHVRAPVMVVYGDRDWSRPDERRRTVAAIPGARHETVAGGGHFLSLDRPEALSALIREFSLPDPGSE